MRQGAPGKILPRAAYWPWCNYTFKYKVGLGFGLVLLASNYAIFYIAIFIFFVIVIVSTCNMLNKETLK